MGLFRNLKDMTDTLRSDELKELKKKADAQPRSSMLDTVKAANSMYDQAGALQQQAVGPVAHRQLLAQTAIPRFQPGATFSVRVDQNDPTKVVIG